MSNKTVMIVDDSGSFRTVVKLALQKAGYGVVEAIDGRDAVGKLGAQKVNLIGGSYGTRAALEFLRQFPQHVRRMVIDGVAPPDMVLPLSFSPDAQAAFGSLP